MFEMQYHMGKITQEWITNYLILPIDSEIIIQDSDNPADNDAFPQTYYRLICYKFVEDNNWTLPPSQIVIPDTYFYMLEDSSAEATTVGAAAQQAAAPPAPQAAPLPQRRDGPEPLRILRF